MRRHSSVIERGYKSFDGVNKVAILISGIVFESLRKASWGDTIQIAFDNQITGPKEDTFMGRHRKELHDVFLPFNNTGFLLAALLPTPFKRASTVHAVLTRIIVQNISIDLWDR